MVLTRLVDTWNTLRRTPSRNEKIQRLSECLAAMTPPEAAIGTRFLAGEVRQGRVGVGGAALRRASAITPSQAPSLTLTEIDQLLTNIASDAGPGSAARRQATLETLFSRATPQEQEFLLGLLGGGLRQGALVSLVVSALAKATSIPLAKMRRALMLSGDLSEVAERALARGAEALAELTLRPFTPVLPMLAQTSESPELAIAALGEAALEHKLDGARIQVHKAGNEVRVYSRGQRDVTASLPEVVEDARRWSAETLVLDGEVIALRADGSPYPFQTTMRRFGRIQDVEAQRAEIPLTPIYFDCLLLNGRSLIDEPLRSRRAALEEAVGAASCSRRLVTGDPAEAAEFFDATLDVGHEGIMVKALDSRYRAGSRGKEWLKVKPAATLDLVVLAAEWGSGRRQGWLSNLHLGARDGDRFVMLGKTFKGLTDELLAWQTEALLALEDHRDETTVYVRPEMVVEIALSDVQTSPHYPAGLALRFARVRGYREDKPPSEADTLDTVRKLHRG